MGHSSALLDLDAGSPLAGNPDCDCAVFGKITAGGPDEFAVVARNALAALARLRASAIPIIVDICDFQLGPGDPRSDVVKQVIAGASAITCNSTEMAAMLRSALPNAPHPVVIHDPLELARNEPKAPPASAAVTAGGGAMRRWFGRTHSATLEPLWFGHFMNLQYLLRVAPVLGDLAHDIRCRLTVCSSDHPAVASGVEQLRRDAGPNLPVRFVPWSLDTIGATISGSDIVIIPTDRNDPAKRGAGSNRLVQALWCGRFVVANPLSSYRELADYAWLGDDLVSGIRWALDHPQKARGRVAAGQSAVESDYAAETIARQWIVEITRNARARP